PLNRSEGELAILRARRVDRRVLFPAAARPSESQSVPLAASSTADRFAESQLQTGQAPSLAPCRVLRISTPLRAPPLLSPSTRSRFPRLTSPARDAQRR